MDSGDESFERWYQLHYPRLVATLAGVTGDREVDCEAADDAVLSAFERWDRVSAMESPAGWLFRVGFNNVKRRQRRSRLERSLLRREAAPDHSAPTGETWHLVRTLSLRQRQAVVLRHVGHLTETEVAEAMGISRGGVSSTLRAAYSNLRSDLAEDVPPTIQRQEII